MAITSNLTTLDLGGDASSSDGAVTEDVQQQKDKKYIDQFRKRQIRLVESDQADKQIEIN